MLALTPLEFFPVFNASLNAACTLILICGWIAIRQRRITLHKALMVTAFSVSTVFLASYLYYHFAVRNPELSKYRGEGAMRTVYFAVLLSHTVLALVVAVFAPITLVLGFSAPGNRHITIARWLMPVWIYVSLTGVVVYWMLYQM